MSLKEGRRNQDLHSLFQSGESERGKRRGQRDEETEEASFAERREKGRTELG